MVTRPRDDKSQLRSDMIKISESDQSSLGREFVTTITALIGSAQALFSDPQPGKPGYGPGMEAIPASAVIDYPI